MTSNFTLLSNDILVYLGSRVPVHIQIEFPEPKYGLKLFGPLYSPSKLCYFGKVILFLNNFFFVHPDTKGCCRNSETFWQ